MDENQRKIILAEHENFETDRLILRKVTMADAPDLFEYTQDSQITEMAGFKAVENLEAEKLDILNFIFPYRLGTFALELKAEKKVIGTIALRLSGDSADFGWTMSRKYWGQGLMPEAARILRDFAFEKLEIAVMTANCWPDNPQSARVMTKLGMKKLGQIYEQDAEKHYRLADYYALSSEEYEKLK